jgi:IclR family pca regulon transcriptional regulator
MSAKPGPAGDHAYRIAALAKGLQILSLFSDRRPALRLAEIVDSLDIPMPTVFRLVATLVGEGYLERLPGGAVRPGIAVLTLGFSALHGLDLVTASRVTLGRLAADTKQTVSLGVLAGDHILFVARHASGALMSTNVTVGSRLPAVASSLGKVLLAYRPGPTLLASGVELDEPLRRQFDRVRADGFAIQDEELAPGLRSIAGPIRRSGDVVAAANISVSSAQFSVEELVSALAPPLLEACADVSQRLG